MEAVTGGRDNGIRSGVRFRRGSRGTLRAGEIPLIGMVEVEPAEPVAARESALTHASEPAPAKKSTKPRRPRKKAAAAAAVAEAPSAEAEAAPAAKRPRSRPRKKAT